MRALLAFLLSISTASAQTIGNSPPTQPTPAGPFALISTQVVSAGPSIAFTGMSTYDYYRLLCEQVFTASATQIYLQVGEGSTPTWETSNYKTFGIYGTSALNVSTPPAASAISLGASPAAYTNNDGAGEYVTLTGGTVSSITVTRGAFVSAALFAATPATLFLSPGDVMTVTYSGVPTAEKLITISPNNGYISTTDPGLLVNGGVTSIATASSVNIVADIANVTSAAVVKPIVFSSGTFQTNWDLEVISTAYTGDTNPVTALRVIAGTGNISGRCSLYGMSQ